MTAMITHLCTSFLVVVLVMMRSAVESNVATIASSVDRSLNQYSSRYVQKISVACASMILETCLPLTSVMYPTSLSTSCSAKYTNSSVSSLSMWSSYHSRAHACFSSSVVSFGLYLANRMYGCMPVLS